MAGDWRACTLADACSAIDYGLTASATTSVFGPKFLRITDIVSGQVDWDKVPRVVSDETTTAKYRLCDGDIVLARTGASTGSSAYVSNPPPAVFASYLVRLRARPDFDARFLAYYLKSDQFWSFIRGVLGDKSAQPNASASTMAKAPLRAPKDKHEQRAIAHILGSLDDKIEINRQMNATLEAMAQALFKSWFVDFDPVRTKGGDYYKGLAMAVGDLFPDSFEHSLLGDIPTGWTVRSLFETAEFINGAAFRESDFCESGDGLPVIKIAELKMGIGTRTRFSSRTTNPRQAIIAGDLLYSWSGSPDTSLDAFLWAGGPGLLNQHIFKVVTPTIAEKRFVYYLLKFLGPALVEIARNKQTTGLGHVTIADMKRLFVCSPPRAILRAFDTCVGPFFDRAFQNVLESSTLAALRDTLLPKLISGELRLSEAERAIEVA